MFSGLNYRIADRPESICKRWAILGELIMR